MLLMYFLYEQESGKCHFVTFAEKNFTNQITDSNWFNDQPNLADNWVEYTLFHLLKLFNRD